MRIIDLLKTENIILNAKIDTKEEMLDAMIDLHYQSGNVTDKAQFKEGIMQREEEGATAIADGICIPHSKNKAVKHAGIAAMTVPTGVDCQALDGNDSNLFFMIAAPEKGADIHLEALSRLSMILMDNALREQLLNTDNVDEFVKLIDEKETEKFGEEKPKRKGFGFFRK